jgi:oligopeptide/dipeptide ABC transporter ATP-binding protein
METGPVDRLFGEFAHPYTEALLSAVPTVPIPAGRDAADGHAGGDRRAKRRDRIVLAGDIPDPSSPPAGCVFHTRCRYARERCRTEIPLPRPVGATVDGAAAGGHAPSDSHHVACHYPLR